MKLSKAGVESLVFEEGIRNKAYKDTVGVWTIGVGHTGPEVKEGLVWTNSQVMVAFRDDVKWAEDAVNALNVPLNQNQFDAMVDFVFNIGETQFNGSTIKKLLLAQDYKAASEQFIKWTKQPELRGRRERTKERFLTPV